MPRLLFKLDLTVSPLELAAQPLPILRVQEAAADTVWNALDTLCRMLGDKFSSRVFYVVTLEGEREHFFARNLKEA